MSLVDDPDERFGFPPAACCGCGAGLAGAPVGQRGSPARLPVTCAPWHHLPVDSDWDRFISRCQQALGDLVEGRPGPFKALWSHADDVVIMGAFGGYERG